MPVIMHNKEIEEYRVFNFVLTSNGEATILVPDALKEKAGTSAEIVLKGLKKPLLVSWGHDPNLQVWKECERVSWPSVSDQSSSPC